MKDAESSLKDARDQLTLVLSFFPRVDAKLSTVLAVDVAMLASMSASVPSFSALTVWSFIPAGLSLLLISVSLGFLYLGGFPNVKGGHSSIVFFKDIASRNESKFIADYGTCKVESLRDDVLAQVWRNSEILTAKYRFLKAAFIAMASAILPWCLTLALFAFQRASLSVKVTQ